MEASGSGSLASGGDGACCRDVGVDMIVDLRIGEEKIGK